MSNETAPGQGVMITGAGMVTTLGHTLSETLEALHKGDSGIRPIAEGGAKGDGFGVGAPIKPIDPHRLMMDMRGFRMMRLQGLMLLKAAQEAFQSAGLDRWGVDGDEMGLFAGVGMVDYEIEDLLPAVQASLDEDGMVDHELFFSHGHREIHPLLLLSLLNNMPPCQVGMHLGIKGENAVFAYQGDAGARAICEGAAAISEGRIRASVVCGVSEKISAASLFRNVVSGNVRSDLSSTRIGMGEGCGVLVLESPVSARQRNVPVMARLSGFGWAFERDGPGSASTGAVLKAVNEAMSVAAAGPDDIDLIMGHFDGTVGDQKEAAALDRVFQNRCKPGRLYASKFALGNLSAASPVVDAALSIHIARTGKFPATGAVLTKKAFSRARDTEQQSVKALRRILINTRSHEGQCASLVITAER